MDDVPQQGAVLTDALVEAKAAGDLMAARRLEDERYAYFAEASIVFLDLPDAVFRGYEGDDQLLAMPRPTIGRRSTSWCARSRAWSRRRSTCRSASATTWTTSSCARSAWPSWSWAGAG